jgi:hypothetical protein
MRKVSLLAAIAALSLAGGTAVAAEATDGKPVKAPKEKKICKGEVNSNSRIAKTRVCRTAAQWAEHEDRQASENNDKPRGRRSGS